MAFCLPRFNTEDPYPGSSIDLKCKEKVTDSDSENGSGDEGERKVGLVYICFFWFSTMYISL